MVAIFGHILALEARASDPTAQEATINLQGTTVTYIGRIDSQNVERLLDLVSGKTVTELVISTGGGEADAGLEIGEWVFDNQIDVVVDGMCMSVVSARMWQWMLAPTRVGIINVLFQKLGVSNGQIPFLRTDAWALPAIIAVDVWKTTPFMALLLLAGLQLIPGDIYEAAEVDGAGWLRRFWGITMPLLRPTLAVALVFRTLDALRVFDVFQVLLAQTRYSMATYNYYQLIGNRDMGISSAIGVIIFLFIFVFAVMYIRFLGVESDG